MVDIHTGLSIFMTCIMIILAGVQSLDRKYFRLYVFAVKGSYERYHYGRLSKILILTAMTIWVIHLLCSITVVILTSDFLFSITTLIAILGLRITYLTYKMRHYDDDLFDGWKKKLKSLIPQRPHIRIATPTPQGT